MRAISIGASFALLLIPFLVSAADIHVSVTDSAFVPRHVTVNPGDKVIWTNTGTRIHTIVSDSNAFTSYQPNGAQFSPGSQYWRTFSTEGIFPYYSQQYGGPGGQGMSGSVSVTIPGYEAPPTPTQNPYGTPAPAVPTTGATGLDALKAQLAALLAQVASLQASVGGGGVPATSGGTGGASGLQCPQISRTLRVGSTGIDVTRLQQFLARDPSVYPEGQVTGYYGALTEAAVKRFQCKNQIVCEGTADSTGYGVTGPRTAALLALQCPAGSSGGGTGSGSSGTPSGFMRVTPTSGPAPHAVTIELTLNTARSCAGSRYEVHFGDASQPVIVNVPPNNCDEFRHTLSYTYQQTGTYTLSLRSGVHQNNATVVVGPPSQTSGGDTLNANTTSGNVPFTVTFSGIANAAAVCDAGPYTILFGDGTTGAIPLTGCGAVNYTISHTYTSGGAFTVRLVKGNPAVEVRAINVTASGSTGGSGGSLNITAGAGGNAMAVQVQFELSRECAAFTLDWGDGSQNLSQSEGTCSGSAVTKSYTHTYSSPGNFTVTLKRGTSLQYTDTASVVISN